MTTDFLALGIGKSSCDRCIAGLGSLPHMGVMQATRKKRYATSTPGYQTGGDDPPHVPSCMCPQPPNGQRQSSHLEPPRTKNFAEEGDTMRCEPGENNNSSKPCPELHSKGIREHAMCKKEIQEVRRAKKLCRPDGAASSCCTTFNGSSMPARNQRKLQGHCRGLAAPWGNSLSRTQASGRNLVEINHSTPCCNTTFHYSTHIHAGLLHRTGFCDPYTNMSHTAMAASRIGKGWKRTYNRFKASVTAPTELGRTAADSSLVTLNIICHWIVVSSCSCRRPYCTSNEIPNKNGRLDRCL